MKIIKRPFKRPYFFIYDLFLNRNKRFLENNVELKNKYLGESANIILTGSSLQIIDILQIPNFYKLGVGFIFLHPLIKNISLNSYLDIEPIKNFDSMTTNWPENYINSNSNSKKRLFYEHLFNTLSTETDYFFLNSNRDFIEKHYPQFKSKRYYLDLINNSKPLINRDYEVEISKRLSTINGCLFTSILVLIYMGFKKIYLVGAGYTYKPRLELHFYDNYTFPSSMDRETCQQKAKKIVASHNNEHNSDINFLRLVEANGYYNALYTSQFIEDKLFYQHKIINEFATFNDVSILNVIPDDFSSPVFKAISFENFYNLKKKDSSESSIAQ